MDKKKCVLHSVFHPWLYTRIYFCSSIDLNDENDVHVLLWPTWKEWSVRLYFQQWLSAMHVTVVTYYLNSLMKPERLRKSWDIWMAWNMLDSDYVDEL
jgi:hypothetical protein